MHSSDGGDVRAEGECFGWSVEGPPPQYGRKPERPLSAALLQYTESFGLQGLCLLLVLLPEVLDIGAMAILHQNSYPLNEGIIMLAYCINSIYIY